MTVSGFGTSALWLVSGVWAKELTGSASLAALCLVALWTPTLAGPLLGALADRVPRRRLLIGASLFLTALLPVLLLVDSPGRVWLLLTVLFVYGATGVVHDAAEGALVTTALPARLLGGFNGLRMSLTEGMKLVAPPAGAALYTLYGAPAVVLLDAATFALAAGVYGRLSAGDGGSGDGAEGARRGGAGLGTGRDGDGGTDVGTSRNAHASTGSGSGTDADADADRGTDANTGSGTDCAASISTDAATGPGTTTSPSTRTAVRHLWSLPRVRPLLLAGAVTMLCAGVNGALVYAVIDGLGRSPAYAGVLYAAQGAGSVAAGLLSGPALRRFGELRFAAWGITLTAVAVALRAVPYDAVALVCGAAIGLGLPCVLIAALTAVQRETPDAFLGRAVATANTLVYAPNVAGLAVGAALVGSVPYRPLLVALGTVWLLTARWCLRAR